MDFPPSSRHVARRADVEGSSAVSVESAISRPGGRDLVGYGDASGTQGQADGAYTIVESWRVLQNDKSEGSVWSECRRSRASSRTEYT